MFKDLEALPGRLQIGLKEDTNPLEGGYKSDPEGEKRLFERYKCNLC